MNNIIEKLFNDIKNEARLSEITYYEVLYNELVECKFRMGFNVVQNNKVSDTLFNFYIHDYDVFIKRLNEYVYTVLNLYQLDFTEYNIKKILILLWANITKEEMYNLDDYVQKYIEFYNNNFLTNIKGVKEIDELGYLNYSFDIQSNKQETPYCFNCYFSNDNDNYYLPRISYGIKDNICYIYAIQNKEKNDENNYSDLVKKKLNTLNSGVKKYRNVTPAAIASLALFLSMLKKNDISNIEVVCNLPIRHQNKRLVDDFKLQIESKSKDIVEVEALKEIMSDKRLKIYYNTTEKFKNNFKRLSNHFNLILRKSENELSENLLLELISLDTTNSLFRQIVESVNTNVIK